MQRVKSFCCHVAEGKSENLKDAFPAGTFSIGEFLGSGDHELQDLQTKMLLGDEQYEFLARKQNSEAFGAALEAAFSRIEVVGIQERYEESMLVSTLVFGWPLADLRKRLNVRSPGNRVRFSDEEIRRIEQMNRWDMLAHRIAREHFEQASGKLAGKVAFLKLRLRFRHLKGAWGFPGRARTL